MGKISLTGNSRTRKRLADVAEGASPFTPPAGLWAWYDASNAGSITASSGLVDQWNDLSGSARHVTATGSLRPTTGSRSMNGLNVLDFNGSNYLQKTSISLAMGTWTVLLVTGTDVTSANTRFVAFDAGGGFNDYDNSNSMMIYSGDTTKTFGAYQANTTVDTGGSGATPIGTWAVRKSTAASGYQITNPAGSTTSVTNSNTGGTATAMLIGCGYQGAVGAQPFDGPLGELLIFSTTLSDGDRTLVRDYLIAKWGA